MKKATLTIMCGIPRCGKSTWIKKNNVKEVIVSPDEIRKEIFGHQFHASSNKFVFAVTEAMTILILKQGIDVIIDATHISRASRSAWRSVANKCDAKVKVVWVRAHKNKERNFLACLERNELSKEGNKLPLDALLRMASFIEDPDSFEEDWFELVEYISPHRRKLPKNKRIIIDKWDGLLQIMQKGEKLWGVVESQEKSS